MARIFYRPAVRGQGEVDTFSQSKMLFATTEAADIEAERLRRYWVPRTREKYETVLLVEVEDAGAVPV
jgi:hypothetical protein